MGNLDLPKELSTLKGAGVIDFTAIVTYLQNILVLYYLLLTTQVVVTFEVLYIINVVQCVEIADARFQIEGNFIQQLPEAFS